jgi:hypothetical protein
VLLISDKTKFYVCPEEVTAFDPDRVIYTNHVDGKIKYYNCINTKISDIATNLVSQHYISRQMPIEYAVEESENFSDVLCGRAHYKIVAK